LKVGLPLLAAAAASIENELASATHSQRVAEDGMQIEARRYDEG
jgi:hypothetical protein